MTQFRFEANGVPRIIGLGSTKLGDLELLTLELYDDGFSIRWQHRAPPRGWGPDFVIRDDTGTRYLIVGGCACGGPGLPLGVMRGETVAAPGLPDTVTDLHLELHGDEAALSVV